MTNDIKTIKHIGKLIFPTFVDITGGRKSPPGKSMTPGPGGLPTYMKPVIRTYMLIYEDIKNRLIRFQQFFYTAVPNAFCCFLENCFLDCLPTHHFLTVFHPYLQLTTTPVDEDPPSKKTRRTYTYYIYIYMYIYRESCSTILLYCTIIHWFSRGGLRPPEPLPFFWGGGPPPSVRPVGYAGLAT